MKIDGIVLFGAFVCGLGVLVGLVAAVLGSRWERNFGHNNEE